MKKLVLAALVVAVAIAPAAAQAKVTVRGACAYFRLPGISASECAATLPLSTTLRWRSRDSGSNSYILSLRRGQRLRVSISKVRYGPDTLAYPVFYGMAYRVGRWWETPGADHGGIQINGFKNGHPPVFAFSGGIGGGHGVDYGGKHRSGTVVVPRTGKWILGEECVPYTPPYQAPCGFKVTIR